MPVNSLLRSRFNIGQTQIITGKLEMGRKSAKQNSYDRKLRRGRWRVYYP